MTIADRKKDTLHVYRKKRRFDRTPEPSARVKKSAKGSRFVIQKHDARRLHYDFRLESGGVLKSWAVPKGPSMNPAEKRLAVPTEDHPLDYADFEGLIPEGEYGAGPVIVWDRGFYLNVSTIKGRPAPLQEALDHGHAAFWLEGEKVRGGFSLTRIAEKAWLLSKSRDSEADAAAVPVESRPRSVLSGMTLEKIKRTAKEK